MGKNLYHGYNDQNYHSFIVVLLKCVENVQKGLIHKLKFIHLSSVPLIGQDRKEAGASPS